MKAFYDTLHDPLKLAPLRLRQISQVTAKTWELSRALTREAGASLLSLKLYPLGFLGNAMPHLPTWKRSGIPERPTPVLFVHGVLHNAAAFAYLAQRLRWRGYERQFQLRLFTSIHSIPTMAKHLAEQVDRIRREYDAPFVDVIAHSMGGLVCRQYIQQMGGDGRIRNLITIGTPHLGTPLSRASILPSLRELDPTSRTLKQLNQAAIPRYTQVVSISGSLDPFTRIGNSGWWPGVRNIELTSVGHAGLLYSRRVFDIITSRFESPTV